MGEAEVCAMIDSLGDVGAAPNGGKPESLARLYKGLRLQVRYEPQEQAVCVALAPRRHGPSRVAGLCQVSCAGEVPRIGRSGRNAVT